MRFELRGNVVKLRVYSFFCFRSNVVSECGLSGDFVRGGWGEVEDEVDETHAALVPYENACPR